MTAKQARRADTAKRSPAERRTKAANVSIFKVLKTPAKKDPKETST
jgi:hypothetical protein